MEISTPKTIEDLPKFTVTGVRGGERSEDGYTRFEVGGSFDRTIEQLSPHWFWLLYGDRAYLTASVKSLDHETNAAVLTCDEENEPQIVGLSLAYLSPYWQVFHVWMVVDPRWIWERKELRGIDALAKDYESNEVSIIEGREVRVWTKLEPVESQGGNSRYYPAEDQALPVHLGTRVVPSGWSYEHCELCRVHIDAGQFGYCDLGRHWMCEKCYGRYVVNHDLAFIDEL